MDRFCQNSAVSIAHRKALEGQQQL